MKNAGWDLFEGIEFWALFVFLLFFFGGWTKVGEFGLSRNVGHRHRLTPRDRHIILYYMRQCRDRLVHELITGSFPIYTRTESHLR